MSAAPEAPKDNAGLEEQKEEDQRSGLIRRVSRKVVPGLPRAQTFKRQQAEVRNNLEPVQPTPAERRARSVDRRLHHVQHGPQFQPDPRTSAPDFLQNDMYNSVASLPSLPPSPLEEKIPGSIGDVTGESPGHGVATEQVAPPHVPDAASVADTASMTTSQYDAMIHGELERTWILNLSMHFRDKSKREKFFVTYRERNTVWRRVTISLDYRNAPENSLELDLLYTKFQRDKSAKIYEAIRESLVDIQFYDTVTNLKLQTSDGRLHVHVVEDVNEIIHYPTVRMIQHLRCRRLKEHEIDFDSHMSGFVYKVRVNGEALIKKEIPGPDTVDEFLYEINALSRLRHSRNVIRFYGVIVDENDEYVKGLLISYADRGALIDIIFDHDHTLPWIRREKWARQIVEGLSEIHEAGFVQGDFTLSNIVIDENDDAKIIDINRRGCPVGWEPPEATPLIESNQRISMYIGVKSDLYQLGMVLWALAEQEDEPEGHGRPLTLSGDSEVPRWYRTIMDTCLADDPRVRVQALNLLGMFPVPSPTTAGLAGRDQISVEEDYSVKQYLVERNQTTGIPVIRTVQQPSDWSYDGSIGHRYVDSATGISNEPYYYPTRGRSPPSPLPSNRDQSERNYTHGRLPWPETAESTTSGCAEVSARSEGEATLDEIDRVQHDHSLMPRTQMKSLPPTANTQEMPDSGSSRSKGSTAKEKRADSAKALEPERRSPGKALALQEPSGITRATEESMDHPQPAIPSDFGFGDRHGTKADKDAGKTQSKAPETQNPLFREAGITAPEPQETTPLVSCKAELQKTESARKGMDFQNEAAKEGRLAEREHDVNGQCSPHPRPKPPPSPCQSSNRSSPVHDLPDDLRGCGSAYDYTVVGDDGFDDDDDLGMLTTTATDEQRK